MDASVDTQEPVTSDPEGESNTSGKITQTFNLGREPRPQDEFLTSLPQARKFSEENPGLCYLGVNHESGSFPTRKHCHQHSHQHGHQHMVTVINQHALISTVINTVSNTVSNAVSTIINAVINTVLMS